MIWFSYLADIGTLFVGLAAVMSAASPILKKTCDVDNLWISTGLCPKTAFGDTR